MENRRDEELRNVTQRDETQKTGKKCLRPKGHTGGSSIGLAGVAEEEQTRTGRHDTGNVKAELSGLTAATCGRGTQRLPSWARLRKPVVTHATPKVQSSENEKTRGTDAVLLLRTLS